MGNDNSKGADPAAPIADDAKVPMTVDQTIPDITPIRIHEEISERIRDLSEKHGILLEKEKFYRQMLEDSEAKHASESAYEDIETEETLLSVRRRLEEERSTTLAQLAGDQAKQLERSMQELRSVSYPERAQMLEEDLLCKAVRKVDKEWSEFEARERLRHQSCILQHQESSRSVFESTISVALKPYLSKLDQLETEANSDRKRKRGSVMEWLSDALSGQVDDLSEASLTEEAHSRPLRRRL